MFSFTCSFFPGDVTMCMCMQQQVTQLTMPTASMDTVTAVSTVLIMEASTAICWDHTVIMDMGSIKHTSPIIPITQTRSITSPSITPVMVMDTVIMVTVTAILLMQHQRRHPFPCRLHPSVLTSEFSTQSNSVPLPVHYCL